MAAPTRSDPTKGKLDPTRCWYHLAVKDVAEAWGPWYATAHKAHVTGGGSPASTDAGTSSKGSKDSSSPLKLGDGRDSSRGRNVPDGPTMGVLKPSPEGLIGTAIELQQIVCQVALGSEHGILLTDSGIAFTWGDNRYGQLGRAVRVKNEENRPFPVMDLVMHEVTQVAAGNHHCLALCSPGLVWSWGRNKFGQLGVGSERDKVSPEKVTVLISEKGKQGGDTQELQLGVNDPIISIGAGGSSSVATSLGSSVWQWGEISKEFNDNATEGSIEFQRPHCVFTREKFLQRFKKMHSKKTHAAKTSILETNCRVLPTPETDEEEVKVLSAAIMELRSALASERKELLEREEKHHHHHHQGKDSAGEVNALEDLQISTAMLERELALIEKDMELLSKNLQSLKAKQEHTREQLNQATLQSNQLEARQDEVSMRVFELPKGSTERKRAQEKLAETRKFIDANQKTRNFLLEQIAESDKEKQRLQFAMHDKRTSWDQYKHKLQVLQELSKAVSETFGEHDSMLKFLKEKKGDFDLHFMANGPRGLGAANGNDFLEVMKDLEADAAFLAGLEATVQAISSSATTSDEVKKLRAKLVVDLLMDLINLRRYWNELQKDRWMKDDLDVSSFFDPVM